MIVACYVVHLYCDNEAAHAYPNGEVDLRNTGGTGEFSGETFGECATEARRRGWVVNRSAGTCLCPRCSGKKVAPTKVNVSTEG